MLVEPREALGRTSSFVATPGHPGELNLTTLFVGKSEPVQTFAIYQLNGDHLTYCIGEPGRPRPTDFTTAPGDGRTLVTLRRQNADWRALKENRNFGFAPE
jgi:hypothetical protein